MRTDDRRWPEIRLLTQFIHEDLSVLLEKILTPRILNCYSSSRQLKKENFFSSSILELDFFMQLSGTERVFPLG